jgi:hypothetical protein
VKENSRSIKKFLAVHFQEGDTVAFISTLHGG